MRLPDTFCRSHSCVFGLLFTLSYKNRADDILLLRSQASHAAITNTSHKNFHITRSLIFSGCLVIYNMTHIKQPESLFQLHSTTLHICLHNQFAPSRPTNFQAAPARFFTFAQFDNTPAQPLKSARFKVLRRLRHFSHYPIFSTTRQRNLVFRLPILYSQTIPTPCTLPNSKPNTLRNS